MWRYTVPISLPRMPYSYWEFCPQSSSNVTGCKFWTRVTALGREPTERATAHTAQRSLSAGAGHAPITPPPTRRWAGACARWRRMYRGLPPRGSEGRGRKQLYASRLLRDGASTSQTEVLRLLFRPFSASASPNPATMSDPEAESLRSTFPSYMAEGERLYLCGEFSKAAHSFSNVSWALNLPVTHHHF